MIDLNHIEARHNAIDLRLIEWARWVRVCPKTWGTTPMFRMYQSKARQWETDPVIHVEINTIAAREIERAVSILPPKHRTATRWFYVFPFVHEGRIRREIGATQEALYQLLTDSRDMLVNRMRCKIVEKEFDNHYSSMV